MTFERTEIPDVIILTPRIFTDDRGYFFESFQQEKFNAFVGKNIVFVQDNESVSKANVIRGLHFQTPPFAQGKLVRVISGSVLDVAVDMRTGSPTYGKHVAVKLSAENKRQLWVPEGFAHGFACLEDDTIFQYKCTNFYAHGGEETMAWDDPSIGVNWGIENPILSEKDLIGNALEGYVSPFTYAP